MERGLEMESSRISFWKSDAPEFELDVSSKSFCKSLRSASSTGKVVQMVSWLGFTCTCFTWIGLIFLPLCGSPANLGDAVDGAAGGGGGGGGGWEGPTGAEMLAFSILTVFSLIISSVRSSSGYHGLIEIRRPLFQIFQILQILKWKWKWKDPTCAIFLKSMGFKDIEYDIPVYQM